MCRVSNISHPPSEPCWAATATLISRTLLLLPRMILMISGRVAYIVHCDTCSTYIFAPPSTYTTGQERNVPSMYILEFACSSTQLGRDMIYRNCSSTG